MKLSWLSKSACVGLLSVALSGCAGYTSKTNLPENLRSVHVTKVPNRIDISQEVSTKSEFQTYRPGLEVELRNAMIERIILDGHLKIESQERADSALEMELVGFDREALRYNADDSIQEFRIYVRADVRFVDKATGTQLYNTKALSGESEYFLSGSRATSEDEAVQEALDDLARNILEHVLEVW